MPSSAPTPSPSDQPPVVVALDVELRPADRDARQQQDERVRQRQRQRRRAALRKRARQMRLHREIVIAEQQIGEERRFGEDDEDHRPPAGRACVDGADRQASFEARSRSAIGAAPRFRRAHASGQSQTMMSTPVADDAQRSPATMRCSTKPDEDGRQRQRQNERREGVARHLQDDVRLRHRAASCRRLAAVIEHQSRVRIAASVRGSRRAGLPTADGGLRRSG